MKLQYDYYTQTEGYPEVKITWSLAAEICDKFGFNTTTAWRLLHDPNIGEVILSDKVKIWAEETMLYRK